MIRIDKTKIESPDILTTQGKTLSFENLAEYRKEPDLFANKERKKISIQENIYRDETVKKALRDNQFEKCCYCEQKISDAGMVEHYRPKNRISTEEKQYYPGYFWLAYDWNNLFWICNPCNLKKRDYFPLANLQESFLFSKKIRKEFPQDLVDKEQPLIIDPSSDFPEKCITFGQLGEAYPHKGQGELNQKMGETTIYFCKLNSDDLREKRRSHVENLRSFYKLSQKIPKIQKILKEENEVSTEKLKNLLQEFLKEASKAKQKLEQSVLDSQPFSSLARIGRKHNYWAEEEQDI